jgi:two-component system, cell cycle response regulator
MPDERPRTAKSAMTPKDILTPSDAGDRPPSVPSAAPSSGAGTASGPLRASMIELDWLSEDTSNLRATETALQVPLTLRERNRASLTLITGLNAGQVFPLEDGETILGRGREAHVRIDDVGVSRQHSRIVQAVDGSFVIEDMESTNGTFVGARSVSRAALASGDHVQIGPNVVLKFALVDETEELLAKQLYESSTRDPLTGAFNRKYFVERLYSEVAYAVRHRSSLSVLIFDLDHFKNVNDTYGHLAGDQALRTVSAQVIKLIRAEDVFARYGGEEFVILVRGIDPRNVLFFAERVRRAIEKLVIVYESLRIQATISIGLACLAECRDPASGRPARGEHALGEAMLLLADERLYRAKSNGRNRVCFE